ncbi:hypothetical protein SAMN05443668_108144 [Cryptosporangium aurantiacum]|uniref:Polyketide cyclase / dehydrase and lipid transport n=1 Tax=Cryptosporangium aurantiacum TaxID=134849 RepID=A0A1M7R7N2_9ACTN|nr:hypothetical protein SAMN05443668_108144 [Cryptosporangium aurantiacum]
MDLIEETFLAVDPDVVSAAIREPRFTADLWPDLDLSVFMDRGRDGVRWSATGALVGSVEVWLEPYGDGVVAHTFVRADLTRRGSTTEPAQIDDWRKTAAEHQRRARHAKAVWWGVKDRLEAGRKPGEPAV